MVKIKRTYKKILNEYNGNGISDPDLLQKAAQVKTQFNNIEKSINQQKLNLEKTYNTAKETYNSSMAQLMQQQAQRNGKSDNSTNNQTAKKTTEKESATSTGNQTNGKSSENLSESELSEQFKTDICKLKKLKIKIDRLNEGRDELQDKIEAYTIILRRAFADANGELYAVKFYYLAANEIIRTFYAMKPNERTFDGFYAITTEVMNKCSLIVSYSEQTYFKNMLIEKLKKNGLFADLF
ncbi:MAG: hypothetical protein SOZ00_07830 [Tidjanibacter sp.]|nr:hypothetical protein [Tidjanibacter sp.]